MASQRPTIPLRKPAAARPVQRIVPPGERPTLRVAQVTPARQAPLRIGEWLVCRGVVTRRQLYQALLVRQAHGWRLGDVVVVLGYASRALVEEEARTFALRHEDKTDHRRRIERIASVAAMLRTS